jgi:hypothetical protein
MPGTTLVLIVSYLMAKSTPWEMQRSVEPVSKKNMGVLVLHELLHLVYWIWISCEGMTYCLWWIDRDGNPTDLW